MKKLILFLVLLFPLMAFAQECDDCDVPAPSKEWTRWTMDLRIAYYHPNSSKANDVLSNDWIDYEFEIAKRFHRHLEIWAGVDWAFRRGDLPDYPKHYSNSTKVSVTPLMAGFKLIFPLTDKLDAYAGAGIGLSYLKIRNRNQFHHLELGPRHYKTHVERNQLSGVAKLGLRYAYGKCTFFDVFVDYYSAEKYKFSKHEFASKHLDLSGIKVGLGLGVFF